MNVAFCAFSEHFNFAFHVRSFLKMSLLWLCWAFLAVRRLSLVAVSRGYSVVAVCRLSLRWLLLLRSMGSRARRLSRCGAWD